MSIMLPETQSILHRFYNLNAEFFQAHALDIQPVQTVWQIQLHTSYGIFDEMEEMYYMMRDLSDSLNTDIFRSEYIFAFSTPKEVIDKIFELKKYINDSLIILENLIKKYEIVSDDSSLKVDKVPHPIRSNLRDFNKINDTLEYVLDSSEVREILKPNESILLKSELNELKFNIFWEKYVTTLNWKFILYCVVILFPLLTIISLDNDYKWISIIALALPFLDSYFAKENIAKSIKIIFSSKFKSKSKIDAFNKWK
jgi:hypothetical protein